MWIRLRHIAFAGLIVALLYIGSLLTHSYGGRTWVDGPTHFIAGMFLALLGFWLGVKIKTKRVFLGALIFTISIAFMWEIFEIFLRKYFPREASFLGFNSPTNDGLSDIIFGTLGGIIILLFIKMKRPQPKSWT